MRFSIINKEKGHPHVTIEIVDILGALISLAYGVTF